MIPIKNDQEIATVLCKGAGKCRRNVIIIEFPKNCKEGLITAYVLQNELWWVSKNDLNMQKGEEKKLITHLK